jgi:DNA-binding MarR family transcriptional regulator
MNPPFDTRPARGFLQVMRAAYPDITVNQLLALFLVAERPGVSVGELQRIMGFAGAGSPSRLVRKLSEWEAYQVPGLGLVRADEDPRDLRVTRVYLSERGRAIVAQALGVLLHG